METVALVVSICSVIVMVISCLIAFFAYKRNRKKDDKEVDERAIRMEDNVEHIRTKIDELVADEKETKAEILDLRQRVTVVEESTKSAHKRIDELIQKVS